MDGQPQRLAYVDTLLGRASESVSPHMRENNASDFTIMSTRVNSQSDTLTIPLQADCWDDVPLDSMRNVFDGWSNREACATAYGCAAFGNL